MAVYIIILLVSLFLFPGKYSMYSPEYNFTLCTMYIVLLVYYLFRQKAYFKNWLRIDVLFLLGYTIVHFQIPFLLTFDIEPQMGNRVLINKGLINYATWMSLVAINLWIIGYSLVIKKRLKQSKNRNDNNFKVNYVLFDTLLLLSFFLFVGVVGSPFLIDGVYDGGRSWGEGANYANLMLRILLYLRIAYFFKDVPKQISVSQLFIRLLKYRIFAFVLISYFLLFLRVGDRGPMMAILFIVAGLYVLYIRPISFSRLILFSFLGAFVMTLIAFGRSREAQGNSNVIERGYSAYMSAENEVNFTEELASSVRMQYYAIELVPDHHPYLYGVSFFSQIFSIIPFGSFVLKDILGIPGTYYASSTFLNTVIQGENYDSGMGTEILADIYINFGLLGTFLIMLLFGCVVAYVTKRALFKEFNYVLIFIILLSSGIYFSRSMILFPLKDIVYLLFINYIFRRVLIK